MDTQGQNVTQLLIAWRAGDHRAMEDLAPLLQRELRLIASRYMAGERVGHILQATALVNEAYLRLIDWKNVEWQNRAQFFAIASQIMRRILVDYARLQHRKKRGGNACKCRYRTLPVSLSREPTNWSRWTRPFRRLNRSLQGRVVSLNCGSLGG